MIQFIALVIAYYYQLSVKNKAKNTQVVDQLSTKEKILIWILCILTPILSGAIFYYGWKKVLPNKAKQANAISWWVVLIGFLLVLPYIYISFLN